MKISDDTIREAYKLARHVYQGKLSKADAINDLEARHSLNRSSAADYITNLGYMLKGERYERTLSIFATEHFLEMILQDFGPDKLVNAISAVEQHLDYYESLPTGSKQPSIRALVARYRGVARSAVSSGGLTVAEQQQFAQQGENLEFQGAFNSSDVADARERVIASIVRRQGQPAFRRQLLTAYDGRCAISECAVEAALEAAHIVPYRGPETNHICNGLLLRADLHTLFDLRLITIDTRAMTVVLGPGLGESGYQEFAGKQLRLPNDPALHPSRTALEEHRAASVASWSKHAVVGPHEQ